MMQARLSITDALATASSQCQHAGFKAVLDRVRRDVQRGSSLSQSLSRHQAIFDGLYVQLTHVGEVAGLLSDVFLRLATHLEKSGALKRKLAMALFYPGLILLVATGAVLFFLTTIVPTFAEMYVDFGQQLPAPTRVVLSISRGLAHYVWLLAAGVGAGGLGLGFVLRTPRGRCTWDRWKLRLPLLGNLLRKGVTARFCRTLGTLLSSGVALDEALRIVVHTTGNLHIEQVLDDVLSRVRRGSSLHQPLEATGVLPAMVVQLIAVGEQTAELDHMLVHAAQHYEQEVDVFLEGLTSVIEPILIIVIGLVLGGILVSLYLPMFELVNTVG